MACCSGEKDLVSKTGQDGAAGEVLGEGATNKETLVFSSGDSGNNSLSENNVNGVTEDARNTLALNIPPANDVPDAKPSTDPSEVDAKPIR